jgi:DNA-binding HxlR family transcriptional regulator
MNTLSIKTGKSGETEKLELDEFYKTLMFQEILDGDFDKYEKFVLLVVLRKTLHFNKWSDRLAMHWLSKATGLSMQKLRDTLKQLEAKGLLEINKSTGGRTLKRGRFNEYSLSEELIFKVFNVWYDIKDENGILLCRVVD